MKTQVRSWRFGAGVSFVLLALAFGAAPGCTYFQNRGRDAAEMFDLGLTFSAKPQIGLYVNCPVIAPIGYGHVDGYYAGVGAGKVGVMKHQQENAGALFWGYEKNTWQNSTGEGPKSGEDQPVGLLAIARGERGERPYKASCKHYFHLGWVGLTANINWVGIGNFFTGWFGVDIMGHDEDSPAPTPAPPPVAKPASASGPTSDRAGVPRVQSGQAAQP